MDNRSNKKTQFVLLAIWGCLCPGLAQPVGITATNQIIFPLLLSTNESPLMTNAEFRCTQGIKVFFCTTDYSQYQNFDAREIDTNQLARMGLDVSRMQADQARLEEDRQKFAQEEAAGQAALAAAQAAQAAQEAEADSARQGTNGAASSSNTTANSPPHKHHHRR